VHTPVGSRQAAIGHEELAAWVALHSVGSLGAGALGRLLARFGSPGGVLAASPEELYAVPKVPRLVLDGVRRAARDLGRHRAAVRRLVAEGIQAVRREDAAYPARLNVLASPPPLLYVRGRLPRDNRRTFGIVGTREPSERGAEVAAAVARYLARHGWVIVSGNAQGIDAAAHCAALAARRPTVLVLPAGIFQFRPHAGYPPPDALWQRAAAVSECHPEAPWTTPAAMARNRLIAALSDAVLVVECRERGGAFSTARHAIALGRRVFVVRFRAPSLSAAGNAAVEAAGAAPIRSLRDLETLLTHDPPRPSTGSGRAEPVEARQGQRDLPW